MDGLEPIEEQLGKLGDFDANATSSSEEVDARADNLLADEKGARAKKLVKSLLQSKKDALPKPPSRNQVSKGTVSRVSANC